MMRQPTAQPDASRFRGLMIIWGTQIALLVIPLIILLFVPVVVRAQSETLLLALAVAGIAAVGMSFVVKSIFVVRAAATRRPDLVTSGYILAFVLCEMCALLGLVAHLTTGARASLYFFAVSALGFLLNFPRRRHVEAATGGQGSDFKTTL